jgi:hypothetical protein
VPLQRTQPLGVHRRQTVDKHLGDDHPVRRGGSVSSVKIVDGAVTTAKVADANITTAKLADANVTEGKLASNAVTTAKLADANVTEGKLASNAVSTAKIVDANITTAKLADDCVTSAKLAPAVALDTSVEAPIVYIGNQKWKLELSTNDLVFSYWNGSAWVVCRTDNRCSVSSFFKFI